MVQTVKINETLSFYGEGTSERFTAPGDEATVEVLDYFWYDGVQYVNADVKMECGWCEGESANFDLEIELLEIVA